MIRNERISDIASQKTKLLVVIFIGSERDIHDEANKAPLMSDFYKIIRSSFVYSSHVKVSISDHLTTVIY
jgi:hypothetical protein